MQVKYPSLDMGNTLNITEPQIGIYIAQRPVYQHVENSHVINMVENCTNSDEEGGFKWFLDKIKMIITYGKLLKDFYELCSFILGLLA